jgi:hypothetical protein
MRLIERGQTEGLAEKVDVFYAYNSLNKKEYDEIKELLNEQK